MTHAILPYDKMVGYNVVPLLLILVKRSYDGKTFFEFETPLLDCLKWNAGMIYETRQIPHINSRG